MDLVFLLFGFGLNKRVSSLVVTTLKVGAGSVGGGGGTFADGGGVWLRCEELLIVGDGVAERFGAGEVHGARGGDFTVVNGATDCNADRDLFLDLFFLPRPLVLLVPTSTGEGMTDGGAGTGGEDNCVEASFPTALRSSKWPAVDGEYSKSLASREAACAATTVTIDTTLERRMRSASKVAAVMTQSKRKTDTATDP